MLGRSARRPFPGLAVSGTGCVVLMSLGGGGLLTDVTLMAGALGRMNFVSWKRPLSCQFLTMGTLCCVSTVHVIGTWGG